jgi:hypothetical protein
MLKNKNKLIAGALVAFGVLSECIFGSTGFGDREKELRDILRNWTYLGKDLARTKAEELIQQGADPTKQDENGQTALYYILPQKLFGRLLKLCKPVINSRDKWGDTAFMWLVKSYLELIDQEKKACVDFQKRINMSCRAGVDLDIRNEIGLTARDIAENAWHKEFVQLMQLSPEEQEQRREMTIRFARLIRSLRAAEERQRLRPVRRGHAVAKKQHPRPVRRLKAVAKKQPKRLVRDSEE